jgi:hypothetical protein
MPTDYDVQAQIAYLSWVASQDAAEERMIRVVRDYVGGKHPTYLSDRQKEFIGLQAKDANHLFAHNMCQLIIDCLVERLEVTGFAPVSVAEQAPSGLDLAARAMEWWQANRMDAMQDAVYEAAARDGAAYIVVDWNATSGAPVWALNYAYDGTQGIRVYRDPSTDAPLFAAKKWQVSDPYNPANNGRTRLTLYFPDRVEKYISSAHANAGIGGMTWEQWQDNEKEPWPIPWTDSAGPLGLAVIPFVNPGGSEIEQVLPLQDALNKSDIDLMATEDAAGFRILYAAGVTAMIGTDGKETPIKISPAHLLRIADPAGRLGAIEPVDPGYLIRASKYWVEVAAGLSRTPQYLFQAMGADQPSGLSLQEQEIGLIHKAERRQRVWGNAWEDVMTLSARLHNLYRPIDAVAVTPLQTQWQSAALPVDPVALRLAEGQARKAQIDAGMPFVAALKAEGKTEEEIAAILAEKDKEAAGAQAQLAQAMLAAQRQFDQGQAAQTETVYG